MALGKRRAHRGDVEVDIDLVPVMNMFLVLIPFLLASSNFLNLQAINTSVPVRAETTEVDIETAKKNEKIKVKAIVKLGTKKMEISAASEQLNEQQLANFRQTVESGDLSDSQIQQALAVALDTIKRSYPQSDTLIVIPDDAVKYAGIVLVMDAARTIDDRPLFPNVVVSAEVG